MTSSQTPVEPEALLDDVVSTLVSVDATINQLMAVKSSLLATANRIAEDDAWGPDADSREMSQRAVATEIGAALRVSDRTIENQMGESARLLQCFPLTAAAFGRGQLSQAHVRVILDAGVPLEDAEARAAFEQAILPRALSESPNRLRPYARQLAERFRRAPFQERHTRARSRRRVWVRDLEDGMSEIGGLVPTAIARGTLERLTEMAFAIKTENARAAKADASGSLIADDSVAGERGIDARSMDELRADLLCDLLLTGTPSGHDTVDGLLGAIQATVEVTIPVTTLTDAVDEAAPAHLEGIGPIDPATARILAGGAPGWDRVMTDPVFGAVLGVDRYRPTAEMRRHLRARDRRCRFPGCRIVARNCDGDHTIDHARGGATTVSNLADFCRRHHMTKHHTRWRVTQLGGGTLEWTSPTGRRYVDRPPGVAGAVMFEDVEARVAAGRGADVAAPF